MAKAKSKPDAKSAKSMPRFLRLAARFTSSKTIIINRL